ncbi:hypothetical protein VP01_7300g2 [Puccinia sorghi]|uniref:Uncharacterized protein n=1 Tax=Puccinia sorghi TaxID=27349 RepID=A0A0L6UD05_9BASI|nr:hypothetical protein VP01_7300g2 [Puccinia sorghi]
MDEINPTILKTTIEAIPVLTEENSDHGIV